MFRRKEEDYEGTDVTGDLLDMDDANLDTSVKRMDDSADTAVDITPPAAPKAAPAAASFRPQAAPVPPVRGGVPAEARSTMPAAAPLQKATKRVLTVGNDIHMKGEISTCDRLVIEGSVDATLKDVHTVELAQTGSFKGVAEIQDAEISGSFEGDLIVNGRLIIYSTGRVMGNISYGEIEIERGGQLSGTIKTAEESKAGSKRAA